MVNLELINIGQMPNDDTGDTHRDAFGKINRNLTALKTALEDAFKTIEIPTSANLNGYTATGTYHQSADAGAVGGTNYPEGAAGLLQVVAAGSAFVYQRYVTTARRSYWRTRVGSLWTGWGRLLDASMLGAASGVASLGADGKIPRPQLPLLTATVIPAGTNADTIVDPGTYYINSDAEATAANNWPIQLAGTLVVERAAAGNSQVTQTYTSRNGAGGAVRTYKRVRFGTSLTWGIWQESARTADTVILEPLTSATDANTLAGATKLYTWTAGAVITGGTNWPAVPSGLVGRGQLEVTAFSTSATYQRLTLPQAAANHPLVFERYGVVGGTWYGWRVAGPVSSAAALPTADYGDVYVDGDGWYTWWSQGGVYLRSGLARIMPAGSNLNTFDVPGTYVCNVSSEASVAQNFPIALAGMLTVEASPASNLQVIQTYTAFPEGNFTSYKRMRFGPAKNWGPWLEQARLKDAMHRVALDTSGVNANTLTADNTFYTWSDGNVLFNGSNWPAIGGTAGAGHMEVFVIGAGLVAQRCTVLANNNKPRIFERFGGGTSWETWRFIAPISSVAFLPSADHGDVYVDGVGMYRWNSSSGTYTPVASLAGAVMMGQGAVLYGEWPGQATATSNRVMSVTGSTYLSAVPGAGSNTAGILARSADSANAAFVGMTISGTSIAYLNFSSHGTAEAPVFLIFTSRNGEAGRIFKDGQWQFGDGTVTPNVTCRMHVSYVGGGTEYGQVFRPKLSGDTVAIQFQNPAGSVAGYIQSNANLSVTYSTTSDYRAKTELGVVRPQDSLDVVNALRPILFRMNGAPADSEPQKGFIAHELQAHVGQAVTGEKDEMMTMPGSENQPKYQGVDLSKVVPDLVGAVQRLSQLLGEANDRIAQLEAAAAPANPE